MKAFAFPILAVLALTSSLHAVPVVVDDFEGADFNADWDGTDSVVLMEGEGAQGSAKFAFVEADTGLLGAVFDNGAANVAIDLYTRIQASGRQFNLMVTTGSAVAADGASINLRHQNGWAVFSDGWQPVDLPVMDPGAWYRLRIICKGWGSDGASYDIELSDAGGSEFTSSVSDLAFYQAGDPNTMPAGAFSFVTKWGGNPGFDVDSVSVEAEDGGGNGGGDPDPGPEPGAEAGPVVVDDLEGADFSADWDGVDSVIINDGEGAQGSAKFATLDPTTGLLGATFDDGNGGAADVLVDFYARVFDVGVRQLNFMLSTDPAVSADAPTVNLRHQGGWAVFSDGWQTLDLPAMEPDTWYRVRVTAKGWGNGGASYGVELSDAGGAEFTSSVEGLTFYQGGDPNTTPVGSFSFSTKWGGNQGFDIDSIDASVAEAPVTVDDPNIAITIANPFAGIELTSNPDPVTAVVTVANDGETKALTIADSSAITGTHGENFSILTTLPITIPAGESQDIELQFDHADATGTFDGIFTINSDDASNPATVLPLQIRVPQPSGTNLISNGDFELDPMSIAQWELVGEPTLVAGIAPGSSKAASLDADQRLLQQVDAESEWYMDFYFQLLETSGRAFNVVFNAPGSEVNIRIQGTGEDVSFWNTFTDDDQWGEPLELPGVVAEERYFMRVVGRGWNGESPNYDILFSEPGGVSLVHRLEGITRFRNGVPSAPIQSFRFTSEWGGVPGYIVDDVRFVNGTPPPDFPFEVTSYDYNSTTNESTITWSAVPGTYYDVETSLDLTPNSWQAVLTTVEANTDPSMDTLAMIPGGIEASQQFVRIVQVQAPPLLETGFEDGAGGWTVSLFPNGAETGTTWEFGEPTNGPGAAYSGTNVAGTGLTADYDDGTTVLLTSPAIDPTGVAGRINLSFWYYLGANGDEGGQVNILEEDGSVIESFDPFFGGEEGNTTEWTQAIFQLPKLDPVRPFKIQFAFLTGNDGTPNNLPGWFIDDVRVGK